MQLIGIKEQYRLYKESIDQGIHQVLNEGNFIMGEQVKTLEKTLADFVGVKHCIAVSSGTDSLLIAMMALGIGPGDEVITVPFTFISSAEVIKFLGATPRFVDIDLDTYTIDVKKMASAITPKTKAIIPVSLFGQMADCLSINAIAEQHKIPVIEDGAQSFGAAQYGKRSCGATTIGSTSFFPTKVFGCYGDGGAIFTDSDQLAHRMRLIRLHGSEEKYTHIHLGMNGRLDTLQAAILLAKFPRLDDELAARRKIGERYSEHLQNVCITPTIQEGNTHVFSQYTIRVSNRDQLLEKTEEKAVPTAIYYPKCLHQQPVFSNLGYKTGDFPFSEQASKEVLSLPIHPWFSEEDQDRVIEAVSALSLLNV
ncbi:MAG: DegT/DnrJ/EryC1/StrS family aminotransferase [Waddliaceae bacterium]